MSTLNNEQIELLVQEVAAFTELSVEDIHEWMLGHLIKYRDLHDFAIRLRRLPTEEESDYIGNYGIENYFKVYNEIYIQSAQPDK